jgi:2-keto-4-pentenoate hydratase
LAFIGTAGARFGSTLAESFAPAAGLTRAKNIRLFTRRISWKGAPAMKRTKRRLHIPQHEFGFVPDTFTLMQESGLDGERLARERDEADRAQMLAEAAQAALFTPNQSRKR